MQSPHPHYSTPPPSHSPKRNGNNGGWKYFLLSMLAVAAICGGLYYWIRDDRADNVNMTDLAAEERAIEEKMLRDSIAAEAAIRRAESESRQLEADMQKALDEENLRLQMSRALVGRKYIGRGRMAGKETELECIFRQDGNADCYADLDNRGNKSYYPAFYSINGKEVEIQIEDYILPLIMTDDFTRLIPNDARSSGDNSMILEIR